MIEVNAVSIIPVSVNNFLNYSDESCGVTDLLDNFIVEDVKEEVMHEELFDDIKYDLKFSHSEYSELPVAEYEGTPETNNQQQTETNKNKFQYTRGGQEEPKFYIETSVKGDKKYHKFKVGMDRFDRHYTKKNGVSFFRCNQKRCSSSISARYPRYETWQDDIPQITSGPSPHMVDGVEHAPNVGKRLKEAANRKIKLEIESDPLKPVTQIQEEVVNNMMETLEHVTDKEEFIRSMPKPGNALRSLYRVRGQIVPPTLDPVTGVQTILGDNQEDTINDNNE